MKIFASLPQNPRYSPAMRNFRIIGWMTMTLAFSGSLFPHHAWAQQPAAPAQPNFDPSDVYYQAWLFTREAETLSKQGRHAEALEKLRSAEKFFETIHRFHPEWKKEMVGDRLGVTKGQINKVLPLAQAQQKKDDIAVAEIIESGGDTRNLSRMPFNPKAPSLEIENARVTELENEVKRLRTALASPANESSREAARASDLAKQRDDLNARLRQTTADLEALRAKLSTAPVQTEMDSLNLRIRSLEQERQAMGMALSQSREEALKSQAKMNTLTADFQAARQQLADLQRNMKLEREKSNQVTGAQLKQLQALEATIKQKDSQIATANNRISSLQKDLQESKDAFQELRTERDDLLRERDHMAALLKLSESGRVQQLIEQNMGLAKELRESKERVELLNQNANENNDSLLEALRDLAITKSKILSLQKEKSAQDQRMNDLEKELLSNEKSLGQGENTVNRQEAEALREIIKRQLRQQELRKKKAQVLLDAAKNKNTGDANYDEAIALLTDEKISLTPEEQKIVDTQRIDGEIFSPYAGSKDSVQAANYEMREQIENFTKSAVRAFGANRLSASREVLEFILEDVHPGHIPTMTKLGIVQLRLEDYSAAALTLRNAVENDETRSNSHRLLGLALYKSGDMPEAEQSVRRALEIDSKDYRSYTLLGNTLFRANQFAEAQLSYEKAIELNPENADVYHNLALLHQRKGEIKLARETYAKALEYGSPPNPELESKLQ